MNKNKNKKFFFSNNNNNKELFLLKILLRTTKIKFLNKREREANRECGIDDKTIEKK